MSQQGLHFRDPAFNLEIVLKRRVCQKEKTLPGKMLIFLHWELFINYL